MAKTPEVEKALAANKAAEQGQPVPDKAPTEEQPKFKLSSITIIEIGALPGKAQATIQYVDEHNVMGSLQWTFDPEQTTVATIIDRARRIAELD